MTWTTRKDPSGGTAHLCGAWKILEHPANGITLWRGAILASTGFRSVTAAKDYIARLPSPQVTHG